MRSRRRVRRRADAEFIIHGSTVAINAILERKGARTALVTTDGLSRHLRDRPHQPARFVQSVLSRSTCRWFRATLRFEVDERMLHDGTVWRPLDEAERARRGAATREAQTSSRSRSCSCTPTRNVDARSADGRILARGDAGRVRHRVAPRFARTARIRTHVDGRGQRLRRSARELVSRDGSNGGSKRDGFGGKSADHAVQRRTVRRRDRARAMHPDARVRAGRRRGRIERDRARRSACANLICFDMGGTTAKACVLQDGAARCRRTISSAATTKGWRSAFRCSTSRRSARAAAASRGSMTAGGAARRPGERGREPGPACYGNGGTQPTVTDAHLVLGHLAADTFLDGRMQLDAAAAERAIDEHIARPLGLDVARPPAASSRSRRRDGQRRARGDDRTRARSARLRADRVRRRRPAARRRRGARTGDRHA